MGLVGQRQLVEDRRRSLPADRGGHGGVAAPTPSYSCLNFYAAAQNDAERGFASLINLFSFSFSFLW